MDKFFKRRVDKKELRDKEEVAREFKLGLDKLSEKISNENLTITLESVPETEGQIAGIKWADADKCTHIWR